MITALSALSLVIASVGMIFAVPAWRLSRMHLEDEETGREKKKLYTAVNDILVGSGDPDNPSFQELLCDIRNALEEQAELAAVIAFHISDGHGGKLPSWWDRHRAPARLRRVPE